MSNFADAKTVVFDADNERGDPRPLRTRELLGVLKTLLREVEYLRGYTKTLEERLSALETAGGVAQ